MSYIQFIRESEAFDELLENGYHMEFCLLSVIAKRARWKSGKSDNLQIGEALIGDHASYGMTRQQYRTAKANLEKLGMITSSSTNKGTVAKLIDSSVYAISEEALNHNASHPTTAQQPPNNHPVTTQQPLNKRIKGKGKKNTPPNPPRGASRFDWRKFETPDWICRESWLDYLEQRGTAKNKETALTRLVAKLEKLSGKNPDLAKAIIEQSIENTWTGLFEVKSWQASNVVPLKKVEPSAPEFEPFPFLR